MFTQEQIQQIEQSPLAEAISLVANRFPEETVFYLVGQEDQVLTDDC